jgi:hypothetical protein
MGEQFLEQLPSSEEKEDEGEEIQAKQVVESLKADPENKELLLRWLDRRQQEVEAANTSEAGLQLNIEVAQIYRDAGLKEYAAQAFRDAAMQAYQEHKDDIYEELTAEAEKLEGAEGV